MFERNWYKNLLASRLDDVLPPNTDLILNEDVGEPTVRAAVLLAHQGHRHISSTGRDWAYDRMVATVDELLDQNHFKSGSGLPTMRLAAGILVIILAGLFATGFLNSMPGHFVQDDPIPSAIQQAQETEEPTEAPTEAPTEEPTEVPTEAPTEPPAPPLALAAFVQQDGTVLYSEPNTNAEVVAVLVSGEGVTILGYDASEGWALVQSDSDLAGWIQAELLGDTAPIIVESVQVAPNTQQQAAPAPQPPAPPAGGGADGGGNAGPPGGGGGNGGPPGSGGGRGGRGGPGGGGRGGN